MTNAQILKLGRSERWYAVRVTPGMQRMAAPIEGAPEHRRGETLIERRLREAGVDVYMPAFWAEVRVRRSRRLRQRRYPLFVGYVFIRHDPRRGFEMIRDIDGVGGIVTISRGGAAAEFLASDIEPIMLDMFKKQKAYEFARMNGIEDAKAQRKARLSATLGRMLGKGRSRGLSLFEHAERCVDGMSPAMQKNVRGIMATLAAVDDEGAVDDLREAVYTVI